MGKRYPFSSQSDEAMAYDDGRQLDQNGVTTGRVKWLRGLIVTENGGTAGTLRLFDSNTETDFDSDSQATLMRLVVYVGANQTVALDFPAPGIKFVTGIIGQLVASGATIIAYGVTVLGYEE